MPKSKIFRPACCKCSVFSPVQNLRTERLYASIWLISWTLLFVHLSILYDCYKSVDKNNSELLDNQNLFDPCNISGIIDFDDLQKMNNTQKELINLNKALSKTESFYPKHSTRILPVFESIQTNITIIQEIFNLQKQNRQICSTILRNRNS
uniref:Uncharacterized protein n=1 Tax=Panagrolaimus sp. PS1159 TaxID=55785 RepID=A0AC35G6S2_9BILA